jgi:translation initiation factor 3 subunit A|uniref:eIF3a PCI domain-containing protein n=1 Tax=Eutreptiella gymnastica TaxID=73025 RepID=A0A7S4GCP0_9EUGL|mmetsp:Transcript_78742/g.132110  ORF Transcript_78742/g.132110 Transcript_78742/m.132110 type:complete len:864 (+) Transcript_78742:64-2655(+)
MFDHGAQTYKPENALKRAEELIAQEQPSRALNALHDVISNRKYRVWQACLEDIMLKHIDLCIDLRKGKHARDGLIQYRAICQQVNVGSLEKVIHHFLDEAETRAQKAQANSQDMASSLAIQDLEAEGETVEEAPETLMMRAVSGETTKDRTDREILMPWIKFLWEAYRTALDITRSNVKLEVIYHDTAKKAFGFCQRYQRKVEFRRLCDIVRLHYIQQGKFANPEQRAALMQNQDSFNRFIETRFKQLQVATHLDLWQEAYKSIEDIHGIITFFKKTPPAKQSIEYFDKLMKVFWVAKNYLFHAYACVKYHNYAFTLASSKLVKKEVNQDENQLVASKVLLAILCVPFWERQNSNRQKDELFTFNVNREKNLKITTLLGSSTIPTRASLILDLQNRKIVDQVYPELKELYEVMEVNFNPLTLCHKIPSVIEFITEKSQLRPYSQALKKVAAVRMVEQVCKVYDTMKVEELCRLCPYYTFGELEPLLVQVAKSGYPGINVAINHQTSTITLTDMQMNCDTLSGELALLNRKLEPVINQCVAAVVPPKKPAELPPQYFTVLAQQLEIEREAILERKRVIEERKEKQEQQEIDKAREMDQEEVLKQEGLKKAEMKRMQEEAAQREANRQKQLQQEEAENQSRALFSEIVNQKGATHLKKAVKQDESIIKDQDRLVEEAKKLISNAREERDKRLKDECKRLDYFERACREEERPLLQKLWQQKIEKEKESMAKSFQSTREQHRTAWEHGIAEKKRLGKMQKYWEKFRDEVLGERQAEEEEKHEAQLAREQQMRADQDEGDDDEEEQEDAEEEAEEEEEPEPPAQEEPKPAAQASNWRDEQPEPEPEPAPKPAAAAPAAGKWVPRHLR